MVTDFETTNVYRDLPPPVWQYIKDKGFLGMSIPREYGGLGFSALDDPTVTAGSAWWWRGFGFATAPMLDGAFVPICVDIDLDGRTEPGLVRRLATGTGDSNTTDRGGS